MAFVTIHAKATICDHSSVNNSSYLYSPGSGRHTHAAALPGNGKSLKLFVFLVYVRSSERELISCEGDNIPLVLLHTLWITQCITSVSSLAPGYVLISSYGPLS